MAGESGTSAFAGERALGRIDWVGRFWDLGFEMDCGESFGEATRPVLGDAEGLVAVIDSMDDMQILGNAALSGCRYLTHWAMGPDPGAMEWLLMVLGRLEQIA